MSGWVGVYVCVCARVFVVACVVDHLDANILFQLYSLLLFFASDRQKFQPYGFSFRRKKKRRRRRKKGRRRTEKKKKGGGEEEE